MSGHGHILQALVTNSCIAVAKGFAAFVTGSGAMLAETIHSAADCGNQLLLLWGVKASEKPADEQHPLGHGRSLYFWSFMVALMLFLGGGVFSIYEGIHKTFHPEPVENVWWGLSVLFFSLVLEGRATLSNIGEMNKRRGDVPFMRYIRNTKDSDLVVVFGENLAATLGLALAIPALLLAWATGDGRYDGIGGLSIGIVLVLVALFLAIEIKSLLVGESGDPELERDVRRVLDSFPDVTGVLHLITIQQGPGQVLLMMKLGFVRTMSIDELCVVVNRIEDAIRNERPELRWCFIEPDRPRTA
jgi:cation diffusion facilitator family transporter